MNFCDFNKLVDEQFDICKQILEVKGREYAPDADGDRLLAFKTASHVLYKTPIQALVGQMSKHTISLYEMADKNNNDLDLWQEKITDSMNYLFLLKGLLYDTYVSEAHI